MSNREVFRLPEFRKLFVAQAISDVGDGMTFMALMLLVNELTHAPAALAVLSIAVAVPSMAVGVFAGAYADRLDRRRIMIVSDSARAVLVLLFVAVGTVERLPILYLVALLQASIGTFFSPARGALIPRVVPRSGLMAANGLGQVSRMIGGLVGTGLTGVLVATSETFWPAFVVDAATFVGSVLIVLRVDRSIGRAPAVPAGRERPHLGASALEGLRVIAHSPTLLATVIGLSIAMLGMGAVNVLFVPFLINVLGESAAWAGPVEAAQTASMVLAGGIVGALGARIAAQSMVVWGLVGIGVLISALSIVPNVLALMAVVFVVGWFITPAHAATQTILQSATTDSLRGRVLGAFGASMSATTIVSTAAAGIFAGVAGVRTVFLVGGVICLIAAAASWALFRLDRGRAAAEASRSAMEPVPGRAADAALEA